MRRICLLIFALFLLFLSFPSPISAQVNGYTSFQITNNSQDDYSVSVGGKAIAWLHDVPGGSNIFFAELLTGRFSQLTPEIKPRKDLYMGLSGKAIVWTEGSGTNTDVFGFLVDPYRQVRITENGLNNQKPKTAGQRLVWQGSDGTNIQIWLYNNESNGKTQISTGATDKANPFISSPNSNYMVAWENADGSLSYWQDADSTVNTAHTPTGGCTDRIGDISGKFVAFVEDCADTDTVRAFYAGADLSSTSDDQVAQMSDTGQTAGRTPDLDGTIVGWVEGTGTSSEIWGCQISNCSGTRVQVTNNSVLDDDPHLGGGIVVFHRQNADTTEDILAYKISGGSTFQLTSDAQADEAPRIKEIGSTGKVWGAWVRTPSGGSDKEIYIAVPDIDTPAGSNVVVSPGNGTQITFPTVSVAGNTRWITKSFFGLPSAPLTGFKLGTIPTYFDIVTTATWSGTASVCVEYYQGNFNDPESLLQILHYEVDSWVDRTTSIDENTDVICANLTSFSDIAFAVRDPTIISSVEPNSSSTLPVNVTIHGSGFLTGPKLTLGGVALGNVEFVDANTLRATIPKTVPVGTHTLVLENHYGSGSTLANAFTVTAPSIEELENLVKAAGFSERLTKRLLSQLAEAKKQLNNNGRINVAIKHLIVFRQTLVNLLKVHKNRDVPFQKFGTIFNQKDEKDKPDYKDFASIDEAKVRELIARTNALIGYLLSKNPLTKTLELLGLGGGALLGGIFLRRAGTFALIGGLVSKLGIRRRRWCYHCKAEHCKLEHKLEKK